MTEAMAMPEASRRVFYTTRAASVALQSLDRIFSEEIIGMVVAAPGIGKTQAVAVWRRKHASKRHIWIEADVLTSPRPILNVLVKSLGVRTGLAMYDAKQQICATLARDSEPAGLIIDEADLLTVRTFDFLRSMWDQVSALRGYDGERGFPLALFGTPKLREMLSRDDLERLRRRCFHKAELPPLNLEELETVLSKWPGLRYDDESPAEILRISKGSFGWVNSIMAVAQKLAARDGKVITRRVLEATKRHLIGLPEED